MIVFGVTFASKSPPSTPFTIYFPAFGGGEYYYETGGSPPTTEANVRTAMPRAVTMRNLYCLYTTAPSAPATVTIMHNGSAGALTLTIPTTGSGTQIVNDLVHTISFALGDTFDLQLSQSSGSGLVLSSCSVEVD
jgi:hypothetical protein